MSSIIKSRFTTWFIASLFCPHIQNLLVRNYFWNNKVKLLSLLSHHPTLVYISSCSILASQTKGLSITWLHTQIFKTLDLLFTLFPHLMSVKINYLSKYHSNHTYFMKLSWFLFCDLWLWNIHHKHVYVYLCAF